jgi:two-component sensor histidine kinase
VKFDAYLAELCRRLGSASTDRGIDIELEAEPLELASEDAVQLGIVVNELITNAVKHAYPPPTRGKIRVRLDGSDGAVRLSVRDFGPGIPGGEPAHPGLGMRLVRQLIQKRGGAVAMVSDGGLSVEVSMPAQNSVQGPP